MFDGRCVKTIVLIRPMRAASRDASSAERPAKTLAQKKIAPSAGGINAKPQVEPVGRERLNDESASERVQRKEG